MSNVKALNPWDWDVRVRERNLAKGILTEADVNKHLMELPDVAEQAETLAMSDIGADEDDGDTSVDSTEDDDDDDDDDQGESSDA